MDGSRWGTTVRWLSAVADELGKPHALVLLTRSAVAASVVLNAAEVEARAARANGTTRLTSWGLARRLGCRLKTAKLCRAVLIELGLEVFLEAPLFRIRIRRQLQLPPTRF